MLFDICRIVNPKNKNILKNVKICVFGVMQTVHKVMQIYAEHIQTARKYTQTHSKHSQTYAKYSQTFQFFVHNSSFYAGLIDVSLLTAFGYRLGGAK